MLTIFELEEGLMYWCNFHGESVVYKRDKNKLLTSYQEKWEEVGIIHSAWKFTEIEGQRNLCPDCNKPMEHVRNLFTIGLNPPQFYLGYYCSQCKKSFEDKNNPLPKLHSGGKSL